VALGGHAVNIQYKRGNFYDRSGSKKIVCRMNIDKIMQRNAVCSPNNWILHPRKCIKRVSLRDYTPGIP
jgi:hypothetical protein